MSADFPTRSAAATKQQPVPALLTKAMIISFYLPIGERTLDRWVSSGQFPKPDIAIGGKARFWRRETVEGWIARKSEGATP